MFPSLFFPLSLKSMNISSDEDLKIKELLRGISPDLAIYIHLLFKVVTVMEN